MVIMEELKVEDRCDRCGAQAFVRVRFTSGELLFCSHDYRALEGALNGKTIAVMDRRELVPA